MHNNQTICLVIPALNEEQSIGKVLDSIPSFVDQVVVINDGSTDQTEQIAREKGALVVNHKVNQGLGIAFKSGVMKVLELGMDVMVNMDADGQFNNNDIIKLVDPIVNLEADFVTASRFKNREYWPKMTKAKFYGNLLMAKLISKIINQRFYDVSCGFRAYSRDTLLRMNLWGKFTYTQETFIDLAFKKLVILEVPVEVRGQREFGKSKMASNLFKYGARTTNIILATLRDYQPMKFFGLISVIGFVIALVLLLFLGSHYLMAGSFSPHKWAGFTGGFFLLLALLFLFAGFVFDMFARMRYNQEESLYFLKKQSLNSHSKKDDSQKN